MARRIYIVGGSGSSLEAILAVSTSETLASITQPTVVEATGGGGGITLTLPPAASNQGRRFSIKKVDAAAGVVTVDANGAELIDADLTYVLSNEDQYVVIVSNGTNWSIVANN
jgi:UDP-3-O-acyl-N-acetylglucosamine deacetylase